MARPGEVVTVDFPGATGIKRRPAVVVSSDLYHAHRPDVIVGVLTTNIAASTAPTDYVLQDWAVAGLHAPTAFRAFFGMTTPTAIKVVGRLFDRDWQQVRDRVTLSFAS
jgi:mRNA interferase MazF